jgi:hypothetical protein
MVSYKDDMNAKVCVCCGQALTEKGYHFSRDPALCACCSSLLDCLDAPVSPDSDEARSAVSEELLAAKAA